jgi:LysM repeat protein
MESDPEIEQEDFNDEEEEIQEDHSQYRRDVRRRPKPASGNSFFRPQYIFIVVIVVLILVIVLMRSGKSRSDEQINSVMAEMANLKNKLSELDAKVSTIQESASELEKSDATYSDHIDTLNKRLTEIENKNVVLEAKAQSSVKKVEKAAIIKTKKSSYEVKRGDTLYSVAKKHGISVEKLQSLNGLGKNQSISPGQKLLIE